jgi:hypothetical protein
MPSTLPYCRLKFGIAYVQASVILQTIAHIVGEDAVVNLLLNVVSFSLVSIISSNDI